VVSVVCLCAKVSDVAIAAAVILHVGHEPAPWRKLSVCAGKEPGQLAKKY
jgi:bacterioferritin-associated ferredoxin